MRDTYISVALPNEHATPNVRITLHNRGVKDNPVTFIVPIFGEEDEIDPSWVLGEMMFKHVLAQRTRGTTVRDLICADRMQCFHLQSPKTEEEKRDQERMHEWRIRVKTTSGFAERSWPAKPSKEILDTFFTEVSAYTDAKRKRPYYKLYEVSRHPWNIEPISYGFLKSVAETGNVTPRKARPHHHNMIQGDRFLAIVGDHRKSQDGIVGIKPLAVVIVDVEADALLLIDLDFFQQVASGREAILASAWWHEWWKNHSDEPSHE